MYIIYFINAVTQNYIYYRIYKATNVIWPHNNLTFIIIKTITNGFFMYI